MIEDVTHSQHDWEDFWYNEYQLSIDQQLCVAYSKLGWNYHTNLEVVTQDDKIIIQCKS